MRLSFDDSIRYILEKDIKCNGSMEEVYNQVTDYTKDFLSENGVIAPNFIIDCIALQKIEDIFHEKAGIAYLQRNFTSDEIKFFYENDIAFYRGDFENLDKQYIIEDFTDMLYLLKYDVEKKFLYAKPIKYNVVNDSKEVGLLC